MVSSWSRGQLAFKKPNTIIVKAIIKSYMHTNAKVIRYTCVHTQSKDGFWRHALEACWLADWEICWTARDCVMAASLPPVSCVCAVTWWEGRRQGWGFCWRGQCLHKRARQKEHVNRLDKEQGWRGRQGGARVKVETITFSFVQVFLCVHKCKRERAKRGCVEGGWHRQI